MLKLKSLHPSTPGHRHNCWNRTTLQLCSLGGDLTMCRVYLAVLYHLVNLLHLYTVLISIFQFWNVSYIFVFLTSHLLIFIYITSTCNFRNTVTFAIDTSFLLSICRQHYAHRDGWLWEFRIVHNLNTAPELWFVTNGSEPAWTTYFMAHVRCNYSGITNNKASERYPHSVGRQHTHFLRHDKKNFSRL